MSQQTRRRMLRRVVAGTVGAVAVGGCLEGTGGDGTSSPDSTATPTPTPTGTPADGRLAVGESAEVGETTVTVTDVLATRQVVTADSAVVATEDRQYLLVTVEGEGMSAVPAPEHLRAHVGGEDHAPAENLVVPADGGIRVAVELPLSVDVGEDAELRWMDGGGTVAAWQIPEDQRSVLADPPAFQDVSFEFPAEVVSGGFPTFDVTLHNTGGPGPFHAVVTTSTGGEKVVRMDVDGDTLAGHTAHVAVDADPGTEGTATFVWGFDRIERSFTVVEG